MNYQGGRRSYIAGLTRVSMGWKKRESSNLMWILEWCNIDYSGEEINEYSYDYYVHFIDMDRRNDCWVTRN